MVTVYAIVMLGLIFFASAGYTVYQIDRERTATSLVTRTSIWVVNQLEFELLRFQASLNQYLAELPDGNTDAVQLRFDILWSRLSPALVGIEGEWLRSAPGAEGILKNLGADLKRYDETVQELSGTPVPLLRAMSDELGLHIERVHEIAVNMNVGSYRQHIREEIDDLQKITVTLLMTLTVVGGVIVVLLLAAVHTLRKAVNREHALRVVAESSNRAKSQFLANMSHELRTPLNAILGFSELIRDQMLGRDQQEKYSEYAGDINRSAVYLRELVDELLDMAKVEAGLITLNEKAFRISETVDWCIHTVRERANDKSLIVETSIQDDFPLVLGDERIISQIILNLLSNAIKFTPERGTIAISVSLSEAGEILILVADTGIGIARDHLEMVLEPFAQVEDVMTRSTHGSGLGLALCRQFAELHGGRLTIASTVGVGTSVTVVLPAWRAQHHIADS